jgi:uncharacterized protein DUF6159
MTRSRRSRPPQLFGLSLRVLVQHRALLIFPLLSLAACLVVIAAVAVPVVLLPGLAGRAAAACCGYLVLACVIVFGNAALIRCADAVLAGQSPAVTDGLRAAGRRTGVIVIWALISATLSLALRAVRFGSLGRLLGLLGVQAWTLLTYLVVPVVVLEGVGPLAAVRRSSELFKRTWGDRVAGQLRMLWLTLPLALPAIIVFVAGASLPGAAGIVIGAAVAGAWLLVVIVMMAAVIAVYQTAIYRFAADGAAPAAFSGADLGRAFRPGHTG